MLAILPTSLMLSPVPWPVYPGSSGLANEPASNPAAGIKKLGCETIVIDYVNSLNLKKILKGLINIITASTLFLVVGAIFKLSIMQ